MLRPGRVDVISPTTAERPRPTNPPRRQRIFLPPAGVEVPRRAAMCTVGVDLSATQARTSCVAIEWQRGEALVTEPVVGIGGDDLDAYLARGDWIAIEAPFGWPAPMVRAVGAYFREEPWPELDKESFRYRRTDLHLREAIPTETRKTLWSPCVVGDAIAMTARRAAQLREDGFRISGRRFDRAGADQVLEVFCPAALAIWGLPHKGYKSKGHDAAQRPEPAGARASLIAALEEQAPWLRWAEGAREACLASDDPLDAVFAALIARAAALGLAKDVPAEDLELARREGWTHLPLHDSLPRLHQYRESRAAEPYPS